jgi:hypothetical protein
MKTSKLFQLDWRDALKSFLVAFVAFAFNWMQVTFVPTLNVSPELKIFIITALAYLSKNFFTKEKEVYSVMSEEIGLPKPR